MNFFLQMGVPNKSWISILSYDDEMKEDQHHSHVLCMKLDEKFDINFNRKMTQVLCINVNPVVYMNLTNSKQNNKVFATYLSPELLSYDLGNSLGINLPKIVEIKFDTIKALKMSENPLNKLKEYISNLSDPVLLKVGDIFYVPKYDIYKVKAITFEKDEREDLTQLGLKLSKSIEIGPLSYSKYP